VKKLLVLGVVAVAGAFASGSYAAQPANPGCFGKDRAAWLHEHSGAEWGAIAGDRAGDNGAINQDYKDGCGGSPA
jgi:hypothetical protein